MSDAVPNAIVKVIRFVTGILMVIACIATFVLAIFTVYAVLIRYILGKPLSGATEWGTMLLIVSMLTLGHSIVDGRAISVSVLVDRFPKKLNIACELVMGILSFVFFAIVGWRLLEQISDSIKFKEAYFVLKTAKWPMYAVLGVTFLGSALGTIAYVINRIVHFKSAKEKNLFDDNPDLAILAHVDEGVEETQGGTEATGTQQREGGAEE